MVGGQWRVLGSHAFDVVPVDIVPARDVTAATNNPGAVQVYVGADTLDDEQAGAVPCRVVVPSGGNVVVDEAVDDCGSTSVFSRL